jgi:hypothetical protein
VATASRRGVRRQGRAAGGGRAEWPRRLAVVCAGGARGRRHAAGGTGSRRLEASSAFSLRTKRQDAASTPRPRTRPPQALAEAARSAAFGGGGRRRAAEEQSGHGVSPWCAQAGAGGRRAGGMRQAEREAGDRKHHPRPRYAQSGRMPLLRQGPALVRRRRLLKRRAPAPSAEAAGGIRQAAEEQSGHGVSPWCAREGARQAACGRREREAGDWKHHPRPRYAQSGRMPLLRHGPALVRRRRLLKLRAPPPSAELAVGRRRKSRVATASRRGVRGRARGRRQLACMNGKQETGSITRVLVTHKAAGCRFYAKAPHSSAAGAC